MSFSTFDDLSPPSKTIAVDDSTNFWESLATGPDGSVDSGKKQNELKTNITIGDNGQIKVNTDPATEGGLLLTNQAIKGFNSSGTKLLELVYGGSNEGDAYIGDYDSGNHGIKYDHSAGALSFKGSLTITGGDGALNLSDGPAESGADVTGSNTAYNTNRANDADVESTYGLDVYGDITLYDSGDIFLYESGNRVGQIYTTSGKVFISADKDGYSLYLRSLYDSVYITADDNIEFTIGIDVPLKIYGSKLEIDTSITFVTDNTCSIGTSTSDRASNIYTYDITMNGAITVDGYEGWTGSFTNGDSETVTVRGGVITNVA